MADRGMAGKQTRLSWPGGFASPVGSSSINHVNKTLGTGPSMCERDPSVF